MSNVRPQMRTTGGLRRLQLFAALEVFSPFANADADPLAIFVGRSMLFLVVVGIANLGAGVSLIVFTWGASFGVWLSRIGIFAVTYYVLSYFASFLFDFSSERAMLSQWWGLQIAIGVTIPIVAAVLAFRFKTKSTSGSDASSDIVP